MSNNSLIQRKAIKPILDKHDIIAQAQSGTGKTASFLIGSMARVDKSNPDVQVIVICPNRELANQIYNNFEAFNLNSSGTTTDFLCFKSNKTATISISIITSPVLSSTIW